MEGQFLKEFKGFARIYNIEVALIILNKKLLQLIIQSYRGQNFQLI